MAPAAPPRGGDKLLKRPWVRPWVLHEGGTTIIGVRFPPLAFRARETLSESRGPMDAFDLRLGEVAAAHRVGVFADAERPPRPVHLLLPEPLREARSEVALRRLEAPVTPLGCHNDHSPPRQGPAQRLELDKVCPALAHLLGPLQGQDLEGAVGGCTAAPPAGHEHVEFLHGAPSADKAAGSAQCSHAVAGGAVEKAPQL